MKKICKLAGTMIFFALLCGCSVESGQAQPPEPTQNTSITASEADHAVLSDAPTADNTVLEKDLSGYEPAPFSSAAFETAVCFPPIMHRLCRTRWDGSTL